MLGYYDNAEGSSHHGKGCSCTLQLQMKSLCPGCNTEHDQDRFLLQSCPQASDYILVACSFCRSDPDTD